MARPCPRGPRLPVILLIPPSLTAVIVVLSQLLMAPGLAYALVQSCAPCACQLIALLLLAHANSSTDGRRPADHDEELDDDHD